MLNLIFFSYDLFRNPKSTRLNALIDKNPVSIFLLKNNSLEIYKGLL